MKCIARLLACLALLFGTTEVSGQTYQGGLRGSIRDPSGAVLPGVTVTLTDEATNVARIASTNELGEYAFASLAPARYRLDAGLSGFAPYSRPGLEVGVQDFLVIDVVLKVGGIQEAITVTGETPLVQKGAASLASTLDEAQLEVLPTPNRHVFLMSVTTPGVVHVGNPFFSRPTDQNNSSLLSLAGGPLRGNVYILDGVAISDIRNRAVVSPNLEAVEEMKVQVSTYDAEMGRTGGGVFNTVHKSGSNRWHGSALWQNRPQWGQGRGFFTKLDGLDAPERPYDVFGGSFGGPVVSDRTFFWLSAEGFRQSLSWNQILVFPTEATARGDFSRTETTIYDPLSLDANGNRLPFPGNVIPAERLDPVGLNLAQQLVSVGSGEVSVAPVIDTHGYQITTKVNHSVSETWDIAGTYLYSDTIEPWGSVYEPLLGGEPAPVFEPGNGDLFRTVHVIALNTTHLPSDTSVLTLRFGYTSFDDSTLAVDAEFDSRDAASLGWQGDWLDQIGVQNFPNIFVEGYGDFGQTHGRWWNLPQRYTTRELSGTLSQFIGSHTLKYGAQWRRLGLDFTRSHSFRFDFTSGFTEGPDPRGSTRGSGDAIASLLLGLPITSPFSDAVLSTPNEFFSDYFGGFIQDDWRVRANLLLTLGLRIEHETGLKERNDNFTVGFSRDDPFPVQVDPPPALGDSPGFPLRGGLVYSGVDGAPRHQWEPSALKLGPRLGFTYSLDDLTVLRGGYGLFWAPYSLPAFFPNETSFGTVGYTATTQYVGSFDGITPASSGSGSEGSLTDPYPSGLIEPSGNGLGLLTQAGGSIHFNDQFRKSPYLQRWSIDVQREIGSVVLRVGYLGSKGSRLSVGGIRDSRVNINQLDARFLSLGAALDDPLPNPFFGQEEFGALSASGTLPRGQLLRPYPQFRDVFAHHVSEGRSRYDSLRFELEKRFRGNWGARVNYTWSNQRDNIYEANTLVADSPAVVYDNSGLDGDFGSSRIHSPHWLNLNGLYRFPSPGGGAAKALLGGWSVAVSALLRSGFPLTITQRNNNLGSAYGFDHQRPNLTGVDPNVSGSTKEIIGNYINPDAFENAPAFTFGDTPQTLDTIRTPKLINWDMSFDKSTAIGAGADLSLRFEILNIFNGVSWGGPRSVFGRPNFGRIQGTRGFPRTLQIMVKVTY